MSEEVGSATAVSRIEYASPPIVEGFCQFSFATPLSWSPVTPGIFYQLVRAEYPSEPEVQQQVQANVAFPNDAAGQAQFTMAQGSQRLLYKNRERDKLLVLSPESISANSLPPYEGWPSLRDRLERAIAKTADVVRGARIATVSIRYINRVVVPRSEYTSPNDFFNIPFKSVGGETAPTSIFQRVESTLPDGETVGTLTFAIAEPVESDDDGEAFLLDLEFRRALPDAADFETALQVADDLKSLENAEFEACVTDRARELFE